MVVAADMGEPVRTFPPDGGYYLGSKISFIPVGYNAFYSVSFDDDILYHGVKLHDDALRQKMLLKACIDLIALFGAEMADGTLDQL